MFVLAAFAGNGDGTFEPRTSYVTTLTPWELVVRDFNVDGKPDVAVANRAANVVSVFIERCA